MMQLQWGILGTSYISEVMAKAIHESTTSQLRAIASRSLSTANEFANKFSIPKFYSDYHDLLNDSEIDVVYIGLPNHLHKEWMVKTAEAGKHILCEKPFVISSVEARDVITIVKQRNVFCMEALMYRCHPFTKKLHELIQTGILGDIKFYNATYTANIAAFANPTAGGSIRNLGCYPISLVRLLANAEPVELQALGRLNSQNKNDHQASAVLKFADDSIAVVSTADDVEMVWQFEVYGTEGHLKIITNPWLPDCHDNQCIIYRNGKEPIDVKITAEKSLYTYQIDTVNKQITHDDISEDEGVSLLDSYGNILVLEEWLRQVKERNVAFIEKKAG